MPTLSPFGLIDRFLYGPAPRDLAVQPALPLHGVTILAVEDSRFSSDALRLMCQRSGARLRRVDRLANAYAHLRVYRPDIVLVDIGLPDGSGACLIRDLVASRPRGPIILAISGDPSTRTTALGAGADAFIEKPFVSLAAFQGAILQYLPDRANNPHSPGAGSPVLADPVALQDDLKHAASLISQNLGPDDRRYLAGFVTGIARSTDDPVLAAAALDLSGAGGVDRLCQLLATRIAASKPAFGNSTS